MGSDVKGKLVCALAFLKERLGMQRYGISSSKRMLTPSGSVFDLHTFLRTTDSMWKS